MEAYLLTMEIPFVASRTEPLLSGFRQHRLEGLEAAVAGAAEVGLVVFLDRPVSLDQRAFRCSPAVDLLDEAVTAVEGANEPLLRVAHQFQYWRKTAAF